MLVVPNFKLDFCKLLNLMALLTSVTIDLLFDWFDITATIFRVGLPYQGRTISCCVNVQSKIIGEGWIHRGPWGGNGGAYWTYKVDVAPILQITLGWGSVIDSILIKSKSCDGNVIGNFQRIGGPGGHNFVTVWPWPSLVYSQIRTEMYPDPFSAPHVGQFWIHLCPDSTLSFVSIVGVFF